MSLFRPPVARLVLLLTFAVSACATDAGVGSSADSGASDAESDRASDGAQDADNTDSDNDGDNDSDNDGGGPDANGHDIGGDDISGDDDVRGDDDDDISGDDDVQGDDDTSVDTAGQSDGGADVSDDRGGDGGVCTFPVDGRCNGGDLEICFEDSDVALTCDDIYESVDMTCRTLDGVPLCVPLVGEPCFLLLPDETGFTVFPCAGDSPGCVDLNCQENVGVCDRDRVDDGYCEADILVFGCVGSQPTGFDCAPGSCEDAICIELPVGELCDGDADGTTSGTFPPILRCADDLECVGESDSGLGTCQQA